MIEEWPKMEYVFSVEMQLRDCFCYTVNLIMIELDMIVLVVKTDANSLKTLGIHNCATTVP